MATPTTGDQVAVDTPAAGPPPWHRRRVLAPVLVVVGYLACAYPIDHPVIRHPTSRILGGNDSLLFGWWLGWVPHAVAHGMNPLLTGHMNAPDQVNGMWNTSVPLLGMLGVPVTAAAGPVATLNLWLALSPVLSASALFFVLRRRFGTLPSAVAGLLYGFSPYVIGHSLGHLHLSVALLPVVALPLLEDVFLRQRHPRRSGVLLGLLTAGFTGNATEVSTYLGVPLILLTLSLLIRYRRTLLVAVCGVVALVAAVLSLGPRLHIRGHDTGIRMPWVVFDRLPLINNALPGRLALYVVLAISILLAWWLHHVTRAGRGRPLAATALVAAALVPLVPLHPLPVQQVGTPRFFTSSAP